jgi:uncharacterized protein
MKKLLFATTLFLFSIQLGYSQGTDIHKDIKELLELTGSAKLAVQMTNQLIDNYKTQVPNVPQDYWEELIKGINEEELVNQLVQIYEKFYTHDEIKELIAFYQTPLGQKMIKSVPLIYQEAAIVGQKWGEKLSMEIVQKLKGKGYIKQ